MKIDEFINRYINTKVDFDNAYGAQCVDLFRQYCKDVLDIPHTGAVEGAKDLFLKYDRLPAEMNYFHRTPAYKNMDISVGDILVWNSTSTNRYGHVGIFVSRVDDKSALVFEQDGFKQDGAKLKIRSLDNLLGVLEFRRYE